MFVVASLGTGILTLERAAATRVFVTATVSHLSAVLLTSALLLMPWVDLASLGIPIGLGGFAGLVYSCGILLRIGRHNVDRSDQTWYAVLPFASYGLLAAAAALCLWRLPASLNVLAVALGLLLAAAIRNSWDMIVFLVTRPKPPG
jgi:hypothetical protein